MLDFPERNGHTAPPTVYSENLTGALYLDKKHEIEAYSEAWNAIHSAALDELNSIETLTAKLKELNDRER